MKENESVFDRLINSDFKIEQELTGFEKQVLTALIVLSNPEEGLIANNRDIADAIGVSRVAISKARKRLVHKIDIIKPGF